MDFTSGMFKPVIDKCEGCDRIVEAEAAKYCRTYANPAAKWKIGLCNFATHAKPEIAATKIRVNPLKAAKRASKAKK
ncbi:MAG: hypothetical protein A2521_09115 [Deltaproteobacteria bacterium RIFOXYD12_FULL_57_12]|nr:MAG: hypothetical protein A2521_09115 [Deltaproteobacteria bacterium RIFOXYD12_FULL_57_12]